MNIDITGIPIALGMYRIHEAGIEKQIPAMLAAMFSRGSKRKRIDDGITFSICGMSLLIWFNAVNI